MKRNLLLFILLVSAKLSLAQNWQPMTPPEPCSLTGITFVDNLTGYAVGFSLLSNESILLKTINGGSTWTSLNILPLNPGGSYSVMFPTMDTGFISDAPGSFYKTSDSGATWTPLILPVGLANSIRFPTGSVGYYVKENGQITNISKTTDGGFTWNQIYSGYNVHGQTLYFISETCGYMFDNLINLYKTSDSGITWTNIGSFGSTRNSVLFTDSVTGYIASTGAIYKTTNSGFNWTPSVIPSNYTIMSIKFPDPDTGYAVGYDNTQHGVILKTLNGGNSWYTISSGFYNMLFDCDFTNAHTGYTVGENIMLKTTNGGGTVDIAHIDPASGIFNLYPSPAQNVLNIELSELTKTSRVSIINTSGQVIIEKLIFDKETQIDIRTLPPGVYFVRLTAEKTVEVKMFVKQ